MMRAATRLLGMISNTGVDRGVVHAMAKVPRHVFVPDHLQARAYDNVPLPIGLEQTISQPTLVARMTDMLRVNRLSRVLEVGTGCGYQTAILAEVASDVYTIELEEELARTASARLRALGYRNIMPRVGDGALGWPERAPFHAVIVTAAARSVPGALVEQLAPGGRMVLPVRHDLILITKDIGGGTKEELMGNVSFVPLR